MKHGTFGDYCFPKIKYWQIISARRNKATFSICFLWLWDLHKLKFTFLQKHEPPKESLIWWRNRTKRRKDEKLFRWKLVDTFCHPMVRIDTPRILHRAPISIAITNVCTGFSLKNICQSIILLVILETHRHFASKFTNKLRFWDLSWNYRIKHAKWNRTHDSAQDSDRGRTVEDDQELCVDNLDNVEERQVRSRTLCVVPSPGLPLDWDQEPHQWPVSLYRGEASGGRAPGPGSRPRLRARLASTWPRLRGQGTPVGGARRTGAAWASHYYRRGHQGKMGSKAWKWSGSDSGDMRPWPPAAVIHLLDGISEMQLI